MLRPSTHPVASAAIKRHRRGSAATLLAVSVTTATLIVGTGCETNPATGKRQFNTYSIEQEVQLGTELGPQLTQEYGGEVQDQQLTRYVDRIGQALAQVTEEYNTELPWEFTLLDSEVINAFALPGGKVFISAGLLREMTNEAQLAGVLGHEIGHVTAQHADQRIGTAMVVAGIASAAGIAAQKTISDQNIEQLAGLVIGVGGQGYLLSYSRDQELEADSLGLRYMSRVGYNPLGQLQVMEILRDAAAGAGSPPEFLSTHPHPDTRIEAINGLLRGEYAYTQNNPEFQLYEDRFQRIVPPRFAALDQARKNQQFAFTGLSGSGLGAVAAAAFTAAEFGREHQVIPVVVVPVGDGHAPHEHADHMASGTDAPAFDFANPLTWCGTCQAMHGHED